jgi:hypothetical protein
LFKAYVEFATKRCSSVLGITFGSLEQGTSNYKHYQAFLLFSRPAGKNITLSTIVRITGTARWKFDGDEDPDYLG